MSLPGEVGSVGEVKEEGMRGGPPESYAFDSEGINGPGMPLRVEIVDRRKINPRAAELAFESGLRQAGVEEPDVAIERIDCGPAVTAPAPAG